MYEERYLTRKKRRSGPAFWDLPFSITFNFFSLNHPVRGFLLRNSALEEL